MRWLWEFSEVLCNLVAGAVFLYHCNVEFRAIAFDGGASVARVFPTDMSAEHDPDAALMLRVKQGDSGAFTQLVDKYKQPVMNLAYRMLRDATEAEDLA